MKRILIVDNYDSFVYNLVQLLDEAGGCNYDVVFNDRIDFEALHLYDNILLSPGPGIPAEAGKTTELLDYCKNTHAILGVCLGFQALVELFGGKLLQLKHPRHGHESLLTITDPHDVLLKGLHSGTRIGRYHSWVVEPASLPPELKVSGVDEDGNIMSVYHERLPLHGVQFHPESIITEAGEQMIRNWIRE